MLERFREVVVETKSIDYDLDPDPTGRFYRPGTAALLELAGDTRNICWCDD